MHTNRSKKEIELKTIIIVNKYLIVVGTCTIIRANRLISTNRAVWFDNGIIRILLDTYDKKSLRKSIIEQDKRICYICGKYIPKEIYPTIDHVIPKSSLWNNNKENLRCCCKRCNDDKSDISIRKYVENIKNNRIKYSYITDERILFLDDFISKLSV